MSEEKVEHKVAKGKVKATAMGYYGGAIIREGHEFQYDGLGEFPLWVEVLKDESPKAEKKASKKEKKEESADSIV